MTEVEYAKMIRSMHRILGWCFIASIILSPIGILILHRGNRIYNSIVRPTDGHDPETARVLEGDSTSNSIIMSWDDIDTGHGD